MLLKRVKKDRKGVTLVELMVTVFVLSFGIMSSLLYFVTAMASTELARDTTVATTHGEYILEEMRSMATLAEITNENWITFVTNNNLNSLPGETITVAFANPTADPLNVTATVSWTRHSRSGNVVLTTELTK